MSGCIINTGESSEKVLLLHVCMHVAYLHEQLACNNPIIRLIYGDTLFVSLALVRTRTPRQTAFRWLCRTLDRSAASVRPRDLYYITSTASSFLICRRISPPHRRQTITRSIILLPPATLAPPAPTETPIINHLSSARLLQHPCLSKCMRSLSSHSTTEPVQPSRTLTCDKAYHKTALALAATVIEQHQSR